ncbi:MAG TPA: protein-L-isoaspartate(D-aspartate) O-methyltransferase [Chitinophagales bacterium]|nr:protein-L-isoaspartate(D-aspartate) O-methyltransferase [Chitinophagales bacterium]
MNQLDTYRQKGLRKELVVKLRDKGIADKNVLNAVESVPRHLFFGNDTIFFESHAYEDKAFPIGEGQTISQPYTVARQSELLEISPKEKVLEIGTGSGYQAAVLASLGAKVYTIERHRKLYERTKTLLEKLGYANVKCFFGDGFEGVPAFAPYDKIIITAAVPELPKKLLQQLAIGGKMVLPYGSEANCRMLRITKQGDDQYSTEEFGLFAFVPMLKGKVF